MTRWAAASLLVVTALFGWVTHRWLVAAALGSVLLVPFLTGFRVPLGRTAQRAVILAAGAAGVALDWIAPAVAGPDLLRRPWTSVVLFGLGAGIAHLFVTRAPAAGEPEPPSTSALTFLPGLLAIMAAGETGGGPVYGAAAVAWIVLSLAAYRAGDGGRPALRELPRRERLVAAGLLAASVILAAASAAGLPPLSRWTERRILRSLGAETGFSERVELGSLDGLLDSDDVVMRLEGPRTDYLRGAVFDHYEIGHWGRLRPIRARAVDPPLPLADAGKVRVTVVSGARDRYFLPRDARAVGARGSGLAVDRFGVLRADVGAAAELTFLPEGPPDFPADEPTAVDLDLPPSLREPLRRLATEWTAGATTSEAKVAAIAAHLAQGFTYSRTFQRRRPDPILDFLLDDHQGHCEYFATAAALLARAAGVPSRVVIGYRVAEENALGGYWMVREKNAHAWTEVFHEGRGFVTLDTTPADLLAQNTPHRARWLGALTDLISARTARLWGQITLFQLTMTGVAVIVVGLVLRQLRRPRGARERVARARAERPPPSLLRLFEVLRRRGVARGDAEPVERYALRVAEAGLDEAAALLRRWAAYRYGGIGDGEALAREMDGLAARLR